MVIKDKKIQPFLANLAVALFLNSQYIIRIAQAYFPFFENIGVKLVFIVSFFIALLAIFMMRKIETTRIHFDITAIVLIYYAITCIIHRNESAVTLLEILTYCMLPFILVWNEVDFGKIVKYTMVLTCPAIFVASKVFTRYNTVNFAIKMVLSHAIVPSMICAIAYIAYYIRFDETKRKIFYSILFGINGFYFYELVTYGSRGPVIAILMFVILVIFFRPNYSDDKVQSHNFKLFLTIGVVLIILSLFGDQILSWIIQVLDSRGIYNRFFQKYYNLMVLGDTSHGRIDIYLTAINGFLSSPLWGNGIDMFYANTQIEFPHNFILQFAYDGGILLLMSILVPLVVSSYRILKLKQYKLFISWSILFCSSVPLVMVSGDIWIKYVFWFLLAFSITQMKAQKYNS